MSRRTIKSNTLIDELFLVPVPPMPIGAKEKEAKPTTIRPDAQTAHYFQYHAERLNISMQDMIALTLNAVAHSTIQPATQTFQLVIDRFKLLFEAHKVPQIHVKSIIESAGEVQFNIGSLTNDELLLNGYSGSIKRVLESVFHVRSAWLDGVEDNAVISDPVYSRAHAFSVWESISAPWPFQGISLSSQTMLAVESDRTSLLDNEAEKPFPEVLLFTVRDIYLDRHMGFKTYELNGIFPTSNIEARACLQALLTIGLSQPEKVNVMGISIDHDGFSAMKSGRLPALCLDRGFPTMWDVKNLISDENVTGSDNLADLLRISA